VIVEQGQLGHKGIATKVSGSQQQRTQSKWWSRKEV